MSLGLIEGIPNTPSHSQQMLTNMNAGEQELISLVGATQGEQIINICAALFHERIKHAAPVLGGRGTSKIFTLSLPTKELVCRLTDSSRSSFYISTDKEIAVMKHVNDSGVAPRLQHADPASNVIIMDRISNVSLTPQILEKDSIHQSLAETLRNLHAIPALENTETTSVFTDIKATVKEGNINFFPPIAREMLSSVEKLEGVFKKHQVSALTHKDLHGNNILYDGKKIYLIDWELAANCDPFMDLAFVSMFFVFDAKSEKTLLKSYFEGEPTPEQQAHYFLMKQVCLCLYACRLLRKVTGVGAMDLSKEDPRVVSLPNYRDFILENYNGSTKSFSIADLKIFSFVFLEKAWRGVDSAEYKNSIKILEA